jgi:threonine synthase
MFRCIVCGAHVGIEEPLPFRCPNATPADRRHVLHRERPHHERGGALVATFADDPVPFIRWADQQHWWRHGRAKGLSEFVLLQIARQLNDAVLQVDGIGFGVTPLRSVKVQRRKVWIKDETHNVAGSHKARHLYGTMLSLLVAEQTTRSRRGGLDRRPLAIASCGNAALGAATVAAAAQWPIEVFVPPSADPWIVDRLRTLGAAVTFCPRRDDDPPGDPCIHRFHDAVDAGALPFTVQGPENALALDGARTIGWEIAEQLPSVHRVVVQIGGGALATALGFGLADTDRFPVMNAVQTVGCAPLAAAWAGVRSAGGVLAAAQQWDEHMRPWVNADGSPPRSAATGILDDETYDWLGVAQVMASGKGAPVVVDEARIEHANRLVDEQLGIEADHTGTAAMAGYLALADAGEIAAGEPVVVTVTGVRR